jgi:ArsR family transcriptional regulator, arsenate/arsenite/antimonite-responsive transcriptional repressor
MDGLPQQACEPTCRPDIPLRFAMKKSPNAEAVGSVDLMFRAFSDRTRLRILHVLQDGELCVGDIVAILRAPQPRVSRHLAYLRKANLVVARKSGQWSHYSLAPAKTVFHRKLLECLARCFGEVPEIKSDAVRAAKIRETGGCCPTS